MSRSTHNFAKPDCSDITCINAGQSSAYGAEGPVDTRYNIYKGLTSNSCIYPTPGDPGPGYDFASYYISTGDPLSIGFSTSPLNPVATELLVTPADLSVAVVFLFTSFTVTDMNGVTKEYLPSPKIISVQQPGAATTLPNLITDDPIPTLTMNRFMFGSWDQVLLEIFRIAPLNFQVLTNPNEILLGSPDRVQIVWPEGYEWSMTFVGPEPDTIFYSRLYTYSSSPAQLSYTLIDQNMTPVPNTNSQIMGAAMCSMFAVFDKPTGYITNRQPFDLTFPPFPPVCYNGLTGITGVTGDIAKGLACIVDFSIDNNPIPVDITCLCVQFYNEDQTISAVGSRVNGKQLVDLLNAMFRKSRLSTTWQAIEDLYYPYFRIVYPDNILQYKITLKKVFFKSDGTRNSCFDELQIYRQGASVTYIKNSPIDGSTLKTTNSDDILNGLSWSVRIGANGCFLP